MTREDLAVGDEVKNGRSGRWAKVVRIDVDGVTGEVTRPRVRLRLGLGLGFHREATWWPASSIAMLERAP